MYQFSTDYKELFRLICEGHTVVGFVDYRFDRGNPDEAPMRDVVQITRHSEGDIFLGARGISYGSIHPFMCQDRGEEATFIGMCEAINLGWIRDDCTRTTELEAEAKEIDAAHTRVIAMWKTEEADWKAREMELVNALAHARTIAGPDNDAQWEKDPSAARRSICDRCDAVLHP